MSYYQQIIICLLFISPHFHRILFCEPWVKLGANGIFEGPGLIERWSDHKENVMPDFVKNQLDFPEMVLELPGLLFLSVKEIFQLFQNVTRDPQVQNESWVSSYIQACCEAFGCKPFQEKFFEIEILCSSDSVFSPDSKYGLKIIGCT